MGLKEFVAFSLLTFLLSFAFLRYKERDNLVSWLVRGLIVLDLSFLLIFTGKLLSLGNLEYTYFKGLGIELKFFIDLAGLFFLWLNLLLFGFIYFFIRLENCSSLWHGLMLMLFSINNLFFISGEALTFVIFWEAMLIPATMFLWFFSGESARRNALEFLLYNFGFSIFLILGILLLFKQKGTFAFGLGGVSEALWVGTLIYLGIMVKTPVFPLHGWLINTYYNLPTPVTAIFSGILSKYALFGFYRLFTGLETVLGLLLLVTIFSALYSALLAWSQRDIKKIFTFMSMSHLNVMLAGALAILPKESPYILVPFSLFHGLLAFILFVYVYHLERCGGPYSIEEYGNLSLSHPFFTTFLTAFLLVLAGFPLFGYFYLEFIVASMVFKFSWIFGFLLAFTMGINLIYKSLIFYKLIFIKRTGSGSLVLKDLNFLHILLSSSVLFLVILLTLYLYPILNSLRSGGV